VLGGWYGEGTGTGWKGIWSSNGRRYFGKRCAGEQ
jgi:hypothetical protein